MKGENKQEKKYSRYTKLVHTQIEVLHNLKHSLSKPTNQHGKECRKQTEMSLKAIVSYFKAYNYHCHLTVHIYQSVF